MYQTDAAGQFHPHILACGKPALTPHLTGQPHQTVGRRNSSRETDTTCPGIHPHRYARIGPAVPDAHGVHAIATQTHRSCPGTGGHTEVSLKHAGCRR